MRREDWLPRLCDVLEAARERPFAWGRHDCCTWALECAQAVTGERRWPPEKMLYKTRAGAMKALAGHGFAGIPDALDATMGARRPVSMARRGDVVLVEVDGVTGCGVVDTTGEMVACAGLAGIVSVPLASATLCWGVE
jgi:hypothetical protein